MTEDNEVYEQTVPNPPAQEEALPEDSKDEEEEESFIKVEDLDPEEKLWPDGPTAGQILEWKDQYEGVYVSSLTFDTHVVWRTMERHEYKRLMKTLEQLAQTQQMTEGDIKLFNEEFITELCTLFPKYNKDGKELAGLPATISNNIMEASGFVALDVRML